LYIDGTLGSSNDLVDSALKLSAPGSKPVTQINRYILRMKDQLNAYVSEKWLHSYNYPGLTGRMPTNSFRTLEGVASEDELNH